MRSKLSSLGVKVNLALLLFFILVWAASGALINHGFDRTQDDATQRSEQALEELGKLALSGVVAGQAEYGGLALENASESGQRAAAFMTAYQAAGAQSQFDPNRLVRAPNGLTYDPDPSRITDVFLPVYVGLTPEVIADIEYSAALDSLLPAMLKSYPGAIREANFDPIAISFLSTNAVIRYYPPVGFTEAFDPNTVLTGLMTRVGPEQNPERKTLWTSPYPDSAGKGIVVTAEVPVYDGDVLRGVLQVDLSLANLVAQVDLLKLTSTGFAFYVDPDGTILQGSSYELIQSEIATGNDQLSTTLDAMRNGNRGEDRVVINGEEMFIGYAPVPGFGGSLAVAASVDELTAEAAAITAGIKDEGEQTIGLTQGAMSVLFVLGLVGATYLNRRLIVKPIAALVTGTRAVAEGDLDARIPAHGDDELATLARSFNEMTSQLRTRSEALEAEGRERQAAQVELSALFAAMTDWVLVVNREGVFVRVPKTSAVPVVTDGESLVGMHLSELLPRAQADAMVANLQRALEERNTFVEEYPVEARDGIHWFSSAVSPISDDEVVIVARDITERVNARQVLEHEVEERTRELRGLLDVSADIGSMLELQPLLDRVVDRIKDIADYARCSVFMVEGTSLVTLNSRSPDAPPIGEFVLRKEDVLPLWDRLSRNLPMIIDDVRGDSDDAMAYRHAVGDLLDTAFRTTSSWMSVPLFTQDRVIGMLTLSHSQPGFYTDRHASLVSGIATQVAVAIENARLYEESQRAARENEALLRADAELFRSLSLDAVLQSLADVTVDVLQADKSIIALTDGFQQRIRASRNITAAGLDHIRERLTSLSFDVSGAPSTFVMSDNETDTRAEARDIWAAEGVRSYVVVSIVTGGRAIGSFLAGFSHLHRFNPSEMRAYQALAERGSVAIQNAELYARSQQAASLEERQRLARELHDSVSQALYGIALGARTARTLLDRDPAQAVEPVDYVLSLAEAGLAEMRALIFELRPESLEIEGLVAALDKQVSATAARHRIEVTADLGEEPQLSLPEKEIFYRVGQEALHNVVKHARAARASVRLVHEAGATVLEVGDDGGGFDAQQAFPGHLGLVSMKERAASIGATLQVASSPGQGTLVRLRKPDDGNGASHP